MKRSYVLILAIGLGLFATASAQLPKVNVNTGSALRNRATVRVPGVEASKAARLRAGANLDASRLRLNANVRNENSVRAGRVGDARVSGRTNAAVETRRRAQNNRDTSTDTARPTGSRGGGEENQVQLRTTLEFRNRLAGIEQMRDVAIQRGDVQLMQRADQLEHALRLRHRAMPPQGSAQLRGRMRQETQAAVQGSGQFQGNAQGQAQAGASGTLPSQQPLPSNTPNSFQQVTSQDTNRVNAARGQARQGAAAAAQTSGRTKAETRAQGQFTASGATRMSNRLRQNASASGERTRGQAQQRFDSANGAAGQIQTNVRGGVNSAAQTADDAAIRAFGQGRAGGDARVRGEINASSSTTGRVQGGRITGSANQAARAAAQLDASRQQANPRGKSAPQGDPVQQSNRDRQGNPEPKGNPEPQGDRESQDDPPKQQKKASEQMPESR